MADDAYATWLETEFGALIDELDLDDRQKRYMRSRWLDQLKWYEGRSKKSQRSYYLLRLTAIVGGLIVPALVSLNVREGDVASTLAWITFCVSLLVAIAVSLEGFFHHGERWRHYRRAAELLKGQGWQLYELSGAYATYKTHGEAFPHFSTAVEAVFAGDVDAYLSRVTAEKPPDAGAQPAKE